MRMSDIGSSEIGSVESDDTLAVLMVIASESWDGHETNTVLCIPIDRHRLSLKLGVFPRRPILIPRLQWAAQAAL